MDIILEKWKGAPARLLASVKRLGSVDLDEVSVLQDAVCAAMPRPELYVPSTEEELAKDLAESLCIGVYAGPMLAAYMILRYCGTGDHNYARLFDAPVPVSDLAYWANGDSAVVHPDARGNRLQQRMMALAEQWRDPKIIGFACTVSPENEHSLANIRALGFEAAARKLLYGGKDRFVMKKQLLPLPGEYRHFKGMPYRVVDIARHSETQGPLVVYRALYGERGLWVRPAEMWFEHIDRGDYHGPRFVYVGP